MTGHATVSSLDIIAVSKKYPVLVQRHVTSVHAPGKIDVKVWCVLTSNIRSRTSRIRINGTTTNITRSNIILTISSANNTSSSIRSCFHFGFGLSFHLFFDFVKDNSRL